jgi:hypothetical protein
MTGYISGPGSGTSDSIMARLSNGEFVVNAAATARNLPLLNAINDNHPAPTRAAFAGGGMVNGQGFGAPVTNVTVLTDAGQSQPKVSKTPNGTGGHDVTVDLRNFVLGTVSDAMVNNAAFAKAVNARTAGFKGS